MKKYFVMMAVALVSCAFVSCGSKQLPTRNNDIVLKQSPAEQYAEKKPMLRVTGEGINFDKNFAVAQAENAARNEFQRRIETIVFNTFSDRGDNMNKNGAVNGQGAMSTDNMTNQQQIAETVASGTIHNLVRVKTDQFQQPDRQLRIVVCLEYMGSTADLVKDMAQSYRSAVQNNISDADRDAFEKRMADFESRLQKRVDMMNQPQD